MANPRPLMVLSFVDEAGPDRSCATGEAVIGQGVMPVVSRVAGAALSTRILAYVVVPTGTVTLRVRVGDPTSGTVLATLTQGVTAGIVVGGSGTYTPSGSPERFFLTGVTSAGTTVIKTASMMFVGDEVPEPIDYEELLIETVPWAELLVAQSLVASTPSFPTYSGPRITHYDALGGGLVRPFLRTVQSDFSSTQGVPLVLSNVGQVFGTSKNTLPWRPQFGSRLEQLRHQANTPILRERVRVYVEEALTLWEPRVVLNRLTVALPSALHRDENVVTLRAGVSIDGASGMHVLETSFASTARNDGTEATPYLLNYRGTTRVWRGMGQVAPPPGVSQSKSLVSSVGLLRPITRARDFRNGGGVSEVLSNVGQVFGTVKFTLPWRPRFGSGLERLRHQANTPVLAALARHYVEEALGLWEPRALASKVSVVPKKTRDSNTLDLRVLCKISLAADDSQFVFDIAVK